MLNTLQIILQEFDSFVVDLQQQFQSDLMKLLKTTPESIQPKHKKFIDTLMEELKNLSISRKEIVEICYDFVKHVPPDYPLLTDDAKQILSNNPDGYVENRIQDNKQNLQDYVNDKIKDLKISI